MKPVKITAELLITPEMFREWSEGDLPETEAMYKHFIKKMIYTKFVNWNIGFGEYEDFIDTDIETKGIKLTITEIK